MLAGQVRRFAGVGPEVVEFGPTVLEKLEQFPPALAQGAGGLEEASLQRAIP